VLESLDLCKVSVVLVKLHGAEFLRKAQVHVCFAYELLGMGFGSDHGAKIIDSLCPFTFHLLQLFPAFGVSGLIPIFNSQQNSTALLLVFSVLCAGFEELILYLLVLLPEVGQFASIAPDREVEGAFGGTISLSDSVAGLACRGL